MNTVVLDDFQGCRVTEAHLIDVNFPSNPRYQVIECNGKKFFLRLPRNLENNEQSLENSAIDTYNNLLAYELAKGLGSKFAVAVQTLKKVKVLNGYERIVAGLVSPYLGSRHIGMLSALEYQGLANRECMSYLFVFEQLVMNVDDKDEHLRVYNKEGRQFAEMVDHGHILNGWRKDFPNAETVKTNTKIKEPSSDYNPYRERSKNELEDPLRIIEETSDSLLKYALENTINQMKNYREIGEISDFLTNKETCMDIPFEILKLRRDNIRSIIDLKAARLGIK